jgi:prepilin peptidase CpaA
LFFGGAFQHPARPIQWGVVIAASLVTMAIDVRSRRIPNVLTLPLLLAGFVRGFAMYGAGGLLDATAACLLLGVPFVALFVVAGGGGGDAKMMAAIGAWLGVRSSVVALLCVTVAGAVIGLAYAASRGRLGPVLGTMKLIGQGLARVASGMQTPGDAAETMPEHTKMMKLPYGIAICAGVCVAAAVTRATL